MTNIDQERFPNGKFDTKFRVIRLSALVMNMLLMSSQNILIGKEAPLGHKAECMRMKTAT
jgi:hypothetical protein